MTTTPLPPLPVTENNHPEHAWRWTPKEIRWMDARDAQWQAYATAARADLEAEVKRLARDFDAVRDAHDRRQAENAKLREELAALRKEALEPPTNKTHRCIKCLHAYRPDNGESEDCPACGHDGTALESKP